MPFLPLTTCLYFVNLFEAIKLEGYTYKKYHYEPKRKNEDHIFIYVIEDSLVLLVEIVGCKAEPCSNADKIYNDHYDNSYLEFPKKGKLYYSLRIEELTHNNINFKYNNTKFIKELTSITNISFLSLNISYSKFESNREEYWIYHASRKERNTTKRISKLFPELMLEERISQWNGINYYFIVFELEDSEGVIHRAVAYETSNPDSYVRKICNSWIKTGKLSGTAISTGSIEREIEFAFSSWKGMKRQERLEKHLKYFYIEMNFKSKENVLSTAMLILKDANLGKCNDIERSTYLCPVNRWVSEELVYKIIKKYYKAYHVIYQHRPFFLKSTKDGQMSYDVFISELNIAIEYQGKQHFEPIEYFGGEEAYKNLKLRDQLKLELSHKNGIKLVYINYWENITPELVIKKIGINPML